MVTPIPIGKMPPELAALEPNLRGYALGLGVQDYRGHKLLMHTGGLPGYVSRVLMVPDAGLGVVVLTNQESGEAFDAIAFHVVDHYLGAPATDWIDAYDKVRAREAAATAEAERTTAAAREAAPEPALPLERYAGAYEDAWYGRVDVARENGRLVIRFAHTPSLVGDLEPWRHDTFVARWRDRELRADAFVTFAFDADGRIDHATMKAVSPATDFSFDFQDLLLRPVGDGAGARR